MGQMNLQNNCCTIKEYTLRLNYEITKLLSISGNYDSQEKFGIGLTLKF